MPDCPPRVEREGKGKGWGGGKDGGKGNWGKSAGKGNWGKGGEKARDTAKAKDMEASRAKARAKACMGWTSWAHGAEKKIGPSSGINGAMMITGIRTTANFVVYSPCIAAA